MTIVHADDRCSAEPSLLSSLGLLAVGLAPSVLWAAVGIPLAIWNFSDPAQRASISNVSASLLFVTVLANLAPFALPVVAVARTQRLDHRTWSRPLRAVAPWVGVASGVSLILTGLATGGMP